MFEMFWGLVVGMCEMFSCLVGNMCEMLGVWLFECVGCFKFFVSLSLFQLKFFFTLRLLTF